MKGKTKKEVKAILWQPGCLNSNGIEKQKRDSISQVGPNWWKLK